MRGRKPKSTKLKILEGNRGKRPINQNEPIPTKGKPRMPSWLRAFPVAAKEWKREGKILWDMGILTIAETGLLANRCYLAAQIQEMATEIEKEGRVAYTSRMDSLGNEIMDARTNPKCVQLAKAITEYRQYGSLLGLDAPSRTKFKVDRRPQTKAEQFRNKKKG